MMDRSLPYALLIGFVLGLCVGYILGRLRQ